MAFVGPVLLLAALCQDPELGDEVKGEEIGFGVRPPKGWKQVPANAPALFKVSAPEGKFSGPVSLLLLRVTPDEPYLVKTLGAKNIDYLKKTYGEIKIVTEDEVKVGGARAHRVHARYKENTSWMYAIGRSPTEFYFVDFTCPTKDEEAARVLLQKVLDSLRFFAGEPSKEVSAGWAATVAALKGAKLPAGSLGENWNKIHVAGRVLGTIMSSVREAKVAGRDGYEFEVVAKMGDPEGGRRIESVKGSFTLDGAFQKQEGDLTLESKAEGKRSYRSVMTLENGGCKVTRTIGGETDETSLDFGPAAFIDSVGDFVRAALAAKGKGKYAIRVATGFNNSTAYELLETADPEKMKVEGGERVVRLILSKSSGFGNRTYLFEDDGRFFSVQTPGIKIEIRRCTKEEFEKEKQP